MVGHLPNDFTEVGWTVQTASIESVLVAVHNAFDPGYARIENVAIEGETV